MHHDGKVKKRKGQVSDIAESFTFFPLKILGHG